MSLGTFLVLLLVYFKGTMNAQTYEDVIVGRIVDVSLWIISALAFVTGLNVLRIRTTLITFLAALATSYVLALVVLTLVPSPLWAVYTFDSSPVCKAEYAMGNYHLCTVAERASYVRYFTPGIAVFSVFFGIFGAAAGCYVGNWRADQIKGREMRRVSPLPPYSGLAGIPLKAASDPEARRERVFDEILKKGKSDTE